MNECPISTASAGPRRKFPAWLAPEACELWESLAASREWKESLLELLDEEVTSRLIAAQRAGLPKQEQMAWDAGMRSLADRFAALSGYTLLGRWMEGPSDVAGHKRLMTIDLYQPSRIIPEGPCVFTSVEAKAYEREMPVSVIAALAEARAGADIFRNILVLEPLIKGQRKNNQPTFFKSLQDVRTMALPRDPLLVGTLPGAPDQLFCLAHWD